MTALHPCHVVWLILERLQRYFAESSSKLYRHSVTGTERRGLLEESEPLCPPLPSSSERLIPRSLRTCLRSNHSTKISFTPYSSTQSLPQSLTILPQPKANTSLVSCKQIGSVTNSIKSNEETSRVADLVLWREANDSLSFLSVHPLPPSLWVDQLILAAAFLTLNAPSLSGCKKFTIAATVALRVLVLQSQLQRQGQLLLLGQGIRHHGESNT